MQITIARLRTGGFDAHKAECKDCKDQRKYDLSESMTCNADFVAQIVEYIYPHKDFDYRPGIQSEYSQYRGDIRVMPCLGHMPE